MRQGFVSPFRLLVGLLAVSAFAADSSLDVLLKNVEARYNHAKTLQVLFTEHYTPPGKAVRTESGILYLRKPGRMRWDYNQPKGKLWVSDGKDWWLYTPADNQVQKGKMNESEDMRAPLAFLLGKLNFNRDFKNLKASADGPDTRITAETRSENLPYSDVEFVVTPENRIREVKATGFNHSVLEFSLDQEKLDVPVNSNLFQFKMPPGATVEDAGQ